MLGMKQEALASELGEDWSQKKISLLEQKDTLDAAILKDVATALKYRWKPYRILMKNRRLILYQTISIIMTML